MGGIWREKEEGSWKGGKGRGEKGEGRGRGREKKKERERGGGGRVRLGAIGSLDVNPAFRVSFGREFEAP